MTLSQPSDSTLRDIVTAFEQAQRARLPKGTQLCDALSKLIASGKIAEGAKLPGERELGAALKLSLGTVQKALNLLMNDGELVREHGRGTFARSNRRAMRELWHYRFRDPESNELLPVYAKVVDRSQVKSEPILKVSLGESDRGYIRISRLINIGDRFTCWSEMFLCATRFNRLLKLPISDVESVNLKQLLNEEFNVPTLAVQQTAMVVTPSKDICKRLAIARGAACLRLQVVATSRRREPITFQKIYVPPVSYELELTESPLEIAKSLAA
jgi:DNA-binding GntR family transcriptional regulator